MTGETPEGKSARRASGGRMGTASQGGGADGGGGGGKSKKELRKKEEEAVREAMKLSYKERAEQRQQMAEIQKDVENKPIEESLNLLNKIHEKIGHTRELQKNTEVLGDLAYLNERQAAGLAQSAKRYDWKRFLEGLKRKAEFKDGRAGLNWIAIGAAVASCFRSVPECDFLLGPLEKPPKEKPAKDNKKRRRDDEEEEQESEGEAELINPGQVAKDAAKETEDIGAKRVKAMINVMRDTFKSQGKTERQQGQAQAAKEVDAFNFLFDPTSFTQTVENIFDLSFLCKERQAALALNEEGVPVVRPPGRAATGTKNTQAVLSLSLAEWQELCDAYAVEEPKVPHRPGYKKDEALQRMMASSSSRGSSGGAASAASAGSD